MVDVLTPKSCSHHVKHHHVEGNGPDDLSTTIRHQRDNVWHFLQYVGRFYFFIWFDLPGYFIRKNRPTAALKAAFWEFSSYALQYTMWKLNWRAAIFVFLLPLAIMRFGLMIGNWGQHALVDRDEPDSDYRSSITLLDVPVSSYSTIVSKLDIIARASADHLPTRAIAIASTTAITPHTISTH